MGFAKIDWVAYRLYNSSLISINTKNNQIHASGNLLLGHRRLSILDLSSLGHQPMLDYDKKINLHQAFLLTSLSWITIAIFGALPLFFSKLNLSFTDAFFESMSGITTTGSTIITNLENAPKSILLWRALLQWLGGIGIIVMAITLMPIMNVGGMLLFKVLNTDSTNEILPNIFFNTCTVCRV
mgnify:CR=1 FL=1